MSLYLDASVVIPRLVRQESSELVRRFLGNRSEELMLSSFATGEVSAAMARLFRMGLIEEAFALQMLESLDVWLAGAVVVVETEAADIRLADRLVRKFELGLRMPDAIHLAACHRHDVVLVTLDRRLAKAAEALNLKCEVPA